MLTTKHALSHASGSADEIAIAESQVTGLVADLALRDRRAWRASGVIAETMPRWSAQWNSGAVLSSGRLTLTGGLVLPAGMAITYINFYNGGTAGATLTHTWACLVDQAGMLLATTVDDTSSSWASVSKKSMQIATTLGGGTPGTYTPSVDTPAWVGICCVGGTMPTPMAINNAGGSVTFMQEAPIFSGNSSTGLTTPISSNPAALTTSNGSPFYANVT